MRKEILPPAYSCKMLDRFFSCIHTTGGATNGTSDHRQIRSICTQHSLRCSQPACFERCACPREHLDKGTRTPLRSVINSLPRARCVPTHLSLRCVAARSHVWRWVWAKSVNRRLLDTKALNSGSCDALWHSALTFEMALITSGMLRKVKNLKLFTCCANLYGRMYTVPILYTQGTKLTKKTEARYGDDKQYRAFVASGDAYLWTRSLRSNVSHTWQTGGPAK